VLWSPCVSVCLIVNQKSHSLIQDYRAEQTIASLYALSAPTCKVIRQGQVETIKAENLVVGDVVSLNVGDIVPADLRLIDGLNLSTDEALLTGESLPISKHPERTLDRADVPLGDRINMLYSASTITRGRGTGFVVTTGMATEVGKIAAMLRETKGGRDKEGSSLAMVYLHKLKHGIASLLGLDGTPLQVKLSKFALLLFALAILLAVIVFSVSVWRIDDEVLIYGICVGVAVIPESLIAVLTITMAVGTKAMAAGNVVVRNLAALEAVGGVTNICSDKTGTLTQGKMITRKVWLCDGTTASVKGSTNPFDPTSGEVEWQGPASGFKATEKGVNKLPKEAKAFVKCISLCNNSTVTDGKNGGTSVSADDLAETSTIDTLSPASWTAVGEPTEIALQVFAMRFGKAKPTIMASEQLHLLAEHPFDSSCKRMSVLLGGADEKSQSATVFTKGALEAVMPLLDASDELKARFTAEAEALAAVIVGGSQTEESGVGERLPGRTTLVEHIRDD